MARELVLTIGAAVVVFCAVQDRVTAAGVRRYAAIQRAALAGAGPPATIDEVVRPAVRRSVEQGALWSGAVMAVGVAAAALRSRRRRRE